MKIVRRLHLRMVLWGLPLLLASVFCLASADEKDVDARVRQWISDLGHRRFVVRQTAYEHLVKLGKPAFPQLEQSCQSALGLHCGVLPSTVQFAVASAVSWQPAAE